LEACPYDRNLVQSNDKDFPLRTVSISTGSHWC